jgi:localization factor PodJL
MRPDLPWNVAGIPPEAREAARAAARREGLSVGEWLTRRILRSFADAGDEDELTRDSLAPRTYAAQDPADAHDRETTEALERVSRSGAELKDVYRRIEEQLRGVARRMDSAERTQTESNRAMSKAATEMNIAAREQTQAFDQLGAHVVGLADRIDRVERANAQNGMKDAVKGLHTGLSRLADQLTQNATQSATQIASLADNLENVAGRLGEARNDAEGTARSLEHRMAALDDRVYLVEKAAQNTSAALERALDKLDAHASEQPQAQRRETETAGAIARLEENVAKLEARGPDPLIERRLDGIEKNLGDLIERLDGNEPTTARAIEDSLKRLLNRVEATENRQRDTVSEFRSALGDATARLSAMEAKVTAAPPPAAQAAPPPAFSALPQSYDAPPFPDVPTPGAPPPFAAGHDPFAPQPAFDAPPPFPAEDPFAPAPAGDAFAAQQPAGDTFLSAARRSARAAASAAEAEQSSRGFAWGAVSKSEPGKEGASRTPYVIIGLVVLVAVALIAAFVLSQGMLGSSSHPQGLGAMFAPKAPAPQPQAGTPLHAVAPDVETAPPAATPPKAATKPVVVPPLQQKQVNAAPVHAVPQQQPPPAQNQQAQQQQLNVVVPSLDHVTQLANAGNAKAQTIIGLKYLNGEGRAVNEAEAAKWLERAAEAGEPVAQYRLGTLYEHGSGVPADAAKATHWYLASAMQGNRKAMHNIAVDYAEGTGIKKDPTEAARWFSKAASLGLVDSQFNLAVLYERGTGVPQSLIDAYKWYAIAATGGDKESKARIDALGTQLSADDRAAAQHAADAFKPALPDARANVAPQQGDL